MSTFATLGSGYYQGNEVKAIHYGKDGRMICKSDAYDAETAERYCRTSLVVCGFDGCIYQVRTGSGGAMSGGRVLIAWTMDDAKGYVRNGETDFGLTSTSPDGTSTISYVGYVADLKEIMK